MRRINLLPLLLCLLSYSAWAQPDLPNNFLTNPLPIACPYDSTGQTLINGYTEWEAYQTSNGEWDGPRDSACFDYARLGGQFFNRCRVMYADLDTNHTLFVRSQLDSTNKLRLDSNNLYKITAIMGNTSRSGYATGGNCPNGLCTGFRLGVEIPDSAGTGTTMRWYSETQNNFNYIEFCIPTEYFPNANHLRQAYFKIVPENPSLTDSMIFTQVIIEDLRYGLRQVKHIAAADFNGTDYDYYFANQFPWWSTNNMLIYTAPTYPSPANISYVEVSPDPNTNTPQTINIYVDAFEYLTQQPYTQLRGGQVVGDTLRHTYNLVNNGGIICMLPFIEKRFDNGNSYTHQGGKLDIQTRACMQFGRGGSMIIPDGVSFHYGSPVSHQGMLALRTGGKIQIGRGAELIVHNTMVIGEYGSDPNKPRIGIELHRGSKLTFAPGSKLSIMLSRYPDTKLYVYMRGGELDDSGLSPQHRAYIERVYDDPTGTLEADFSLYGNPVREQICFSLQAEAGLEVSVTLFNLEGKQLLKSDMVTEKGVNSFDLPVSTLAKGLYFLRLNTPTEQLTKKIILE